FNQRLAAAFMAEGDDCSIVSFSLQYPSFLFPGTTQYSSDPAPDNITIHTLINSVNPLNWLSVGNRIRKWKPDLIVVRYWLPFMGPCFGTILRIAKKNKHSKVVCIADNIIPHEKRAGDVPFTKYFVKPVDAFVTMSEKVLGDLKIFNQNKPALYIPHPLYDNFGDKIPKQQARENLGLNSHDKIILFFGFIRKYKGLDILLDAMAFLKNKMPGLKLLIAGEFYDDKKLYEEQVERLGITDSLVLRTEFIPDNEIRNYLCAADLVVQPYRNATQSGVTPLAYHFEIPMVVTNVGGLAAMVPHDKAGLVAEPNATSIAEQIEAYFEKGTAHFMPGLLEEKKKYSWQVMTDSIISLAKL
ncbi:MAG: glycosyltransferase, partial [Sphingobacteriales bacterium]